MRRTTKLQDKLIGAAKKGLRPKEILDFKQIPAAIRPALAELLSDLSDCVSSKIKEETKTTTRFDPESVQGIRKELGLSQNQFASLCGCSPESVRNWEHGRAIPGGAFVAFLYKICEEHGIDIPTFFKPKNYFRSKHKPHHFLKPKKKKQREKKKK